MKPHSLIVSLTVLAVAMGGSTRVEIQGVLLFLAGAIMVFFPAQGLPERRIAILAILLAVLPWTAFLPAPWFGDFPGAQLLSDDNIAFKGYLTGQPAVTAQTALMLAFALIWGSYLISQDWDERRESSLRIFVSVMAMIAVLALIQFYGGWKPPFFDGVDDLTIGPFPNRNHSGNVFAIVGIASMGLQWQALTRRTIGLPEYALTTLLLGMAATLTTSRAATLLFVAGVGASFLFHLRGIRSDKRHAVMLSAFLILVSVLLTAGEGYLSRFENLHAVALDPRGPVQRDAYSLAMKTPAIGVGLGQFNPVFPLYRTLSGDHSDPQIGGLATKRAIHPESDWLWFWVECGWLGMVLIGWLIGALLKGALPLRQGMEGEVRLGAFLAVVLFLVHGLVDVPGHLMGTGMTAILLLALARARNAKSARAGLRWIWRALGLLSAGLGVLMIGSAKVNDWPFKTTGSVRKLRQDGLASLQSGHREEAFAKFDAALDIAPLDWEMYYLRALSSPSDRDARKIGADFRTASILEPNSVDAAYREGEFWMRRGIVQIALIPWKDCLTRTTDSGRIHKMVRLVRDVGHDPLMLRHIMPEDAEQWSAFLSTLHHSEFPRAFAEIRERNPQLLGWNSEQLRRLFALLVRSPIEELSSLPLEHPTFAALVPWHVFAAHYASVGSFAEVGRLLTQHAPLSELRDVEHKPAELSRLRQRMLIAPNDTINVVRLYQAEKAAGNEMERIELLDKLCRQTNCPPIIHLEQLHWSLSQGKPKPAWQAWKDFERAGRDRDNDGLNPRRSSSSLQD